MYFANLAPERMLFSESAEPLHEPEVGHDVPAQFHRYVAGSAWTEGYYKISHTEKSAYVTQYALWGMTTTVTDRDRERRSVKIRRHVLAVESCQCSSAHPGPGGGQPGSACNGSIKGRGCWPIASTR